MVILSVNDVYNLCKRFLQGVMQCRLQGHLMSFPTRHRQLDKVRPLRYYQKYGIQNSKGISRRMASNPRIGAPVGTNRSNRMRPRR